MKTLLYGVTRCAGRYDLARRGKWCPDRNTCQRYLAFDEWDKKAGIPDNQRISFVMGMPYCGMKIEMVEVEK